MKILLTGANGNLGQALQRLGSTHEWVGLGRDQWSELPKLIEGVDMIIHAASDLVTPTWREPEQVMESNLMTTAKLLQVLKNQSVKRLVFISTCAVYGRSEETQEESTLAPISVNGLTKLLDEALIQEFCAHHQIDYQIFRLFNTYGGQDRFSIISHLQRSLANHENFKMFNNGRSKRDFIYVDDVAQVILALIDQPVDHPIMNIGSGEAISIGEIVAEFQKKNPGLEISHAERDETEYSRGDITKLRQILPDYQFRKVLEFIQTEL